MNNIERIQELPHELLDHIFSFINIYSLKNIKKINIIKPIPIKQIAIRRIQLSYLIMKKYKILKNMILGKLLKFFEYNLGMSEVLHNGPPCIFYAPHIKNGICRICNNHEDTHNFSEKLIVNFYYPLLCN